MKNCNSLRDQKEKLQHFRGQNEKNRNILYMKNIYIDVIRVKILIKN